MGLVTNVYWTCPGCGSRERAQIYGEWNDPDEFNVVAVPGDRSLKWNPPCTKCGKFRLIEPASVEYKPVPVRSPDDDPYPE